VRGREGGREGASERDRNRNRDEENTGKQREREGEATERRRERESETTYFGVVRESLVVPAVLVPPSPPPLPSAFPRPTLDASYTVAPPRPFRRRARAAPFAIRLFTTLQAVTTSSSSTRFLIPLTYPAMPPPPPDDGPEPLAPLCS